MISFATAKGATNLRTSAARALPVGFLYIGAKILIDELQLPYPMAPWWAFTAIFGMGGLFAAGGLSALFGRNWLLRGLLAGLARGNV